MEQFEKALQQTEINDWRDISAFLDKLKSAPGDLPEADGEKFLELLTSGAAFVTYDFGIDGVSIEIAKYADCLERICPGIPLHFIAGDFHEEAGIVLKDYWRRFRIDDFNGWNKWRGGKPFARLFYEDMPAGSEVSRAAAREIWNEAKAFALKLAVYFRGNNIRL
ncbi:MAG: hypothetical protein PHV59_03210, partial [Victivallales bacterium]|nr:hypothetical protein [Victivallales bacterium]